MPFYLVTHTSLVEAANEDAAARAVLDAVRRDLVVRFEVRFDSETVAQVDVSGSTVAAPLNDGVSNAVETAKLEVPSTLDGQEPGASCQHMVDHSKRWHWWRRKVVLSVAVLGVTGIAYWTLLP